MNNNHRQRLWAKPLLAFYVFSVALFSLSVCASCSNKSESEAPSMPPPPPVNTAVAAKAFTSVERNFLNELSKNMKTAPVAEARINAIIQKLDAAPKLETIDYEYLMNLSGRVKNKTISTYLEQIANNHRP